MYVQHNSTFLLRVIFWTVRYILRFSYICELQKKTSGRCRLSGLLLGYIYTFGSVNRYLLPYCEPRRGNFYSPALNGATSSMWPQCKKYLLIRFEIHRWPVHISCVISRSLIIPPTSWLELQKYLWTSIVMKGVVEKSSKRHLTGLIPLKLQKCCELTAHLFVYVQLWCGGMNWTQLIGQQWGGMTASSWVWSSPGSD